MNGSGMRSLLVGVAAVLVPAVMVTVVAIRGEPQQLADRFTASSLRECAAPEGEVWTPSPPGGFDGHGIVAETLKELVRASDLILVGTAEATRVADVIGEGPHDAFPTRTVHTTVAVEEVLGGSESGGCVVVSTQELAFRSPGIEDWRERGRRVLLFLARSPDRNEPDVYVPTNLTTFQAAYFVAGDEVEITVPDGADVTGLNRRIAAMSLPLLRERVGTVQP